MICFDFVYCRPSTLKEAADACVQLQKENKSPLYYGGGSEIITMCRVGAIRPSAVIDIKNIPECNRLSSDGERIHIGAACTLNQIKSSGLFPLLALACGRIADHTNQNRITLGGNLCGSIIYRETSLPLLASDAEVTLFGPRGERTIPLCGVFNGKLCPADGEFAVQVHVPAWAANTPHFHVKKTACEKIDYPLVSVAALAKDNFLRVAFSGVCPAPFRSAQIEQTLNNRALPISGRAKKALSQLPAPPHTDTEASGEYRAFVLENTLKEILEKWENDKI